MLRDAQVGAWFTLRQPKAAVRVQQESGRGAGLT
jgi:hypothetical protein